MKTKPAKTRITAVSGESDFAGGMIAAVAAFEWSQTPLGPRDSWPECLRIAVELCLNCRFPMHVWWGPELINIFNDAHIPVLGDRYPTALGRSAREVWSDVWPVISPQVDAVMNRGESTWNEKVRVVLERNNSFEDAWFTWSYSPLRDSAGKIAGLLCVSTEDTAEVLLKQRQDRLEEQRKLHLGENTARADEALSDTDTLLRAIIDATGDAIFAKDRRGRFRFANPATLALLGRPPGEVLGKTDAQLLGDENASRTVMENDRRIMESGSGEDIEEYVPLPDGTRSVWFSRKMPYHDAEGNVIGLLGISRDITKRVDVEKEGRRARDAAEAASKAKDHLLSVVSHELRTPLNPILAITSFLLSRPDLSTELREDIDTIRRNVEQEARIVDDLLNLTRLAKGKIVLHHEVVDLHPMIETLARQFLIPAVARQIDLTTSLKAAQHHAWVDAGRMQQVFSNLLGNAVKFTPAGGKISVRTSTTSKGALRIEIADTGIGITSDILPKLFTPFEQGETTVARRFGGLGLGLVIVKGIVDLHKGQIFVSSGGSGMGTTVAVELESLKPVEAEASPPPKSPGVPPVARKRILLVEDHADTLRVMVRVLKTLGYEVLTAASVHEANAIIRDEQFDLLVSDIGLPDGSGLDIMRSLKDRKNCKGIALSGFGNDEDIRRSKEAGFVEHLIKPVDVRTLETTLRTLAA